MVSRLSASRLPAGLQQAGTDVKAIAEGKKFQIEGSPLSAPHR